MSLDCHLHLIASVLQDGFSKKRQKCSPSPPSSSTRVLSTRTPSKWRDKWLVSLVWTAFRSEDKMWSSMAKYRVADMVASAQPLSFCLSSMMASNSFDISEQASKRRNLDKSRSFWTPGWSLYSSGQALQLTIECKTALPVTSLTPISSLQNFARSLARAERVSKQLHYQWWQRVSDL